MILNHLDLYVPDVTATRTFFEEYFGLVHRATRGGGRLAVLYDDAGLELVISEPLGKLGGAEQVSLGLTTYHVGFRLPTATEVDGVFHAVRAGHGQQVDAPKRMRGLYLFYCLAPGNILVEVSAPDDET